MSKVPIGFIENLIDLVFSPWQRLGGFQKFGGHYIIFGVLVVTISQLRLDAFQQIGVLRLPPIPASLLGGRLDIHLDERQ